MKILIIGAGPTGLTLAADLRRRGLASRLVEQRAEPNQLSKALAVQSGTLRCFEHTLGEAFVKRLLLAGRKVKSANVYVDDSDPIDFDLSSIPEPYPYILMLPQSQTEAILARELKRLGGAIEWNTEVKSLRQSESHVTANFADGTCETYDYVIGCDGAHSIVRKSIGADFTGGQYGASFALGDVDILWDKPIGVHVFLRGNGFVAAFPFSSPGHYRVIYMGRHLKQEGPIDLATFSAELQTIYPEAPGFSNPRWLTRFSVHHRLAETFQKGRLFLAGDAAHIHSPLGGQGMNLGIQDALNLSNKLALLGHEDLLDDYTPERRKVADTIIKATDRVTSLGIKENTWLMKFGRRNILPKLIARHWTQRRVALNISQVKWAEEEIPRYSPA